LYVVYAASSFDSCSEVSDQLKQNIVNQLNGTKEQILKDFQLHDNEKTKIINKIQDDTIKELSKSKQDSEKMALDLKEKIQGSLDVFQQKSEEKRNQLAMQLTNLKQHLKDYKDEQKDQIVEQVSEGEEIQINTLVSQVAAVIKDVDEILDFQMDSLLEKAMTFYQVINTREDELRQVDSAASSYSFTSPYSILLNCHK